MEKLTIKQEYAKALEETSSDMEAYKKVADRLIESHSYAPRLLRKAIEELQNAHEEIRGYRL